MLRIFKWKDSDGLNRYAYSHYSQKVKILRIMMSRVHIKSQGNDHVSR
jgi:hypothetical protein